MSERRVSYTVRDMFGTDTFALDASLTVTYVPAQNYFQVTNANGEVIVAIHNVQRLWKNQAVDVS